MTVPGSFDGVVKGASAVIHAAAAVMLTAKNPQRDIVDVTVNGTRWLLASCRKAIAEDPATAALLRRFVLVSSIAAVQDNQRPAGHVYTEADYNESVTLRSDPYSLSKLLAERAAADFFTAPAAVDDGAAAADAANDRAPASLTAAFVNPGAIYGPVLSTAHVRSSPTILLDLMAGKIPMLPQLGFPAVDVRDVAAAAITAALIQPTLHGRYICVEGTYTVGDLAKLAKDAFPQARVGGAFPPFFFEGSVTHFDTWRGTVQVSGADPAQRVRGAAMRDRVGCVFFAAAHRSEWWWAGSCILARCSTSA